MEDVSKVSNISLYMMSTLDELLSIAITSIATTTSMSVDSSAVDISPVPVPKPVGIFPAPTQASVVLEMAVVSKRARNDREMFVLSENESTGSLLVGSSCF
ncbi:hypothetical protein CPB97_008481 [Podila verticillata]|nr:hypothetical protein CPB97_008481 [Podila verticillata]